MNKLWDYRDYVEHLSRKNGLVKRWALRGLENRYWNAYADEVSLLMGDDDEYIVCNAIRYLARHQAVQYAPAILEAFKNNTNIIAGNSAAALGRMHYEPAMDTILEHFYKPDDSETFLGMLNYLSYIQTEQTREALRAAITNLDEDILYRPAIQSLFSHRHTEECRQDHDPYLPCRVRGQSLHYQQLDAPERRHTLFRAGASSDGSRGDAA